MSETLEEAKQRLRGMLEEGARCPCCTQIAKIYKRKIHSGMASRLIRLYRLSGHDSPWIDVNQIYATAGSLAPLDLPYLRFWGLIEKSGDTPDEGQKSNGLWRITEKGKQFVRCRITVPKYIHMYDGRCLKVVGDQVSVKDALGDKFNYEQLMRGE